MDKETIDNQKIEFILAPIMDEMGLQGISKRGLRMGWSERQGLIISAIRQWRNRIKELELNLKLVTEDRDRISQQTIKANLNVISGIDALTKAVSKLTLEAKNSEANKDA